MFVQYCYKINILYINWLMEQIEIGSSVTVSAISIKMFFKYFIALQQVDTVTKSLTTKISN